MDKFKNFIQQNKTLLDTKEPQENVWLAIQQQLPVRQKKALVFTIAKWAAAACVIGLCGWAIVYFTTATNQQNSIVKKIVYPNQPVEKTIVNPENKQQDFASNNSSVDHVQNTEIPSIKNKTQQSKQQQPTIAQREEADAALVSMESSFINIINLQKAKISSTPLYAESPAYFNDFIVRFKQMDKDEQQLKKAIAKQGLTDELLSQLINLYQQKLNVLKAMQSEINKTNNRFLQNRNPAEKQTTSFINI